jgi:uncharacterized circularly permuted ATP-grasp superfamily protein/uncharacterized alpha-E superfamily protein
VSALVTTTDPADAGIVHARFRALGSDRLRRARGEAQRLLDEDGVTYQRTIDGKRRDQRWRLDPVPLVLTPGEWAEVESGIVQRAQLLNLVLADVYGPRRLLREGLLPPEVVFGHPGFLRPLDQVRLPGFHQLTHVATDLVQDEDGHWQPLSDRTGTPSGAGYALENRTVLGRVLPDLMQDSPVERLAPYLRALRRTLQRAAPPDRTDPRIAVLSPGTRDETAFEHAHVAGLLGYPLVEGRDLAVIDGHVALRTVGGQPERIDVLLRRVDAWWCDPLELRSNSRLGTPGLVEAARRGGVTVVNGLGSGVLENAGLLAYLPRLAQALLGQDLHLTPPRTLWCGEEGQRREVLAHLDELVLKPIARTGNVPAIDGSRLATDELDELRGRIEANPHRWVGQERVTSRLVPSLSAGGSIEQRPVVLRTFAVGNGESYTPMRGGLTRVGDGRALTITNLGGAWSKDTWVLGDEPETTDALWLLDGPRVAPDAAESSVSARAVENLLWFGRYAERSEATVRLLRAIDARRAESVRGVPALAATLDRLLVAVTTTTGTLPGFSDDVPLRTAPGAELRALVVDEDRLGTLAHDVRRLVDAGQAVREQLSEDTWPVLAALERDVLGVDDEPPLLSHPAIGPPAGRAALARVLTALLALQGLGAESLVRDPSWTFLEVGRRLERALQLGALLRATMVEVADDATESLVLESVLVTAESVVTYRRRYRGRGQAAAALDLLLLDERNPRSFTWQVQRLLEVLPELPGHPGPGHLSTVEEHVRSVLAALRTIDVDRIATVDGPPGRARRPELDRLLTHLTGLLRRAAGSLEADSFPHVPRQRALVAARPEASGDALLP